MNRRHKESHPKRKKPAIKRTKKSSILDMKFYNAAGPIRQCGGYLSNISRPCPLPCSRRLALLSFVPNAIPSLMFPSYAAAAVACCCR